MRSVVAGSLAVMLLGAASAPGQVATGKCAQAKLTCVANFATGLLGCHAKAESKGVAVDPACVAKVTGKFSDPTTGKGCIEKAEAKPPCVQTGEARCRAAEIDSFVGTVVTAVDPTYPAPVLDKCSAGKKKCVATKVKGLLGCYGKAAKKGEAVDPACVAKAQDKFDGGADPAKGCFEKLEAKYDPSSATPCRTFDDTAAVEATVDAFARSTNTIPAFPSFLTLTFTPSGGSGTCGESRDGNGIILKTIPCGAVLFGDGTAPIPTALTPPGTRSLFSLQCEACGPGCTVGPTSRSPAVNTADPDCTTTGCRFGTPLPIPNPSIPGLSTCLQHTWKAPASGTLDLATGRWMPNVPLTTDIYLTGNLTQPCPRCSASGSAGIAGMGTCDRGPRAGLACTTTNFDGLTRDCSTGGIGPSKPCTAGGGACIDGSYIGALTIDLSPLTTATSSLGSPTGLFCPSQFEPGCFGNPSCRSFEVRGSPAGPVVYATPAPVTVGSVFCVPQTGIGIIDASSGLPGPGAVALQGELVVQ